MQNLVLIVLLANIPKKLAFSIIKATLMVELFGLPTPYFTKIPFKSTHIILKLHK